MFYSENIIFMEPHPLIAKIQSWDEDIRQGKFGSAKADILQLSMAQVPRALVAPVATIAYRVGLSYWSLKLLNPIMRSEKPIFPAVKPEEKLAYAASLFRIGVMQEGFDLLKQIDSNKHPIALLHQAFGKFKLWEYQESIPVLKKFLKLTSQNDYFHIVGQVNLVAAFIFVEDYIAAESLAQQILKKTADSGYSLLHGNALELLSQIRIFNGHYEDAAVFLELSEKRLSKGAGSYSFFVKKWKTVAKWLQQPSEKTLQELNLLREEAVSLRHWETLRECDYYQAIKTKDQALLIHLGFGTPFSGYRRRMRKMFGSLVQLKGGYSWNLRGETDSASQLVILDPHSSRWVTEQDSSELSQGLRVALIALCKDFYRPLPQGELFSEIFPGEYFNAFTSPSRLDLVIRRLQRWFHKNKIPLVIEVINKEYRLIAVGPCSIEVYRQQKPKTRYELLLSNLQTKMQHKSFRISEACLLLNISSSTVQRVLKFGVDHHKVYKTDRGPACRYRFQK